VPEPAFARFSTNSGTPPTVTGTDGSLAGGTDVAPSCWHRKREPL